MANTDTHTPDRMHTPSAATQTQGKRVVCLSNQLPGIGRHGWMARTPRVLQPNTYAANYARAHAHQHDVRSHYEHIFINHPCGAVARCKGIAASSCTGEPFMFPCFFVLPFMRETSTRDSHNLPALLRWRGVCVCAQGDN